MKELTQEEKKFVLEIKECYSVLQLLNEQMEENKILLENTNLNFDRSNIIANTCKDISNFLQNQKIELEQ